ncbi:MAG TPA: hypothetical protein VIX15_11135 [Streptosporangiaceae bacterium]
MTTRQHKHHTPSASHLRRALSRSARALRNAHDEQVHAWDRYFRGGLPGEPRR